MAFVSVATIQGDEPCRKKIKRSSGFSGVWPLPARQRHGQISTRTRGLGPVVSVLFGFSLSEVSCQGGRHSIARAVYGLKIRRQVSLGSGGIACRDLLM